MKSKFKLLLPFIWSAGATALLSYWAYETEKSFNTLAYVIFGAAILIIGLGLYFKVNNFKSEKAGLTPEDELSKRIKEKAGAMAFKFSIFMWVFGVLFFVDMGPQAKIVVGLGVLGMGLVFFATWLYLSKVGISDDD